MQEQKSKKVVFTFGRFQPPTSGHQLLIDKVVDVANKKKAEHRIYASPGSDPKRNPLSYTNKIKYMKRMFPNANIVKNASMKNPFIVAQSLSDEGYEEVTMVVGSDRVSEMRKALNRYIDEFGFKKLTVVSAGKRDPDAEGAAGMSGTKMRKAAAEGNMRDFKKGVPKKLSKTDTEGLFKAVRRGMGIRERKILGFVEHEEYSEFNEQVVENMGYYLPGQSTTKHGGKSGRGGKPGPRMSKQRRHREEVLMHLITNGIKVTNQPEMVTQKGSSDTFAVSQNQVKKAEKILDDFFKRAYIAKSGMRRNTYKIVAEDINEKVYKDSGLGKWFGSGGKGGAGGGGWDRYNTKGERIGKCGDAKAAEGKPKCLSKAKAAKLRAQGGKKAIANAVKRKKAQDPQTDRPGTGNKPINVSNRIDKDPKKKGIQDQNNPRIPRKKGQPAGSKKHSDLYTDENPKGTIHGLGFKDVETAKASVRKIESSSRSHAHKIQAAIAMEQRARVMGKTSEAAVYRAYINKMKKKTKERNEDINEMKVKAPAGYHWMKHGKNEYKLMKNPEGGFKPHPTASEVADFELQKMHFKGSGVNPNKKTDEETKMKSFNDYISEKNVPNDPKKWSAAKAAAKAKFDVYPSAYANAWASKKYKSMGGTWRKA